MTSATPKPRAGEHVPMTPGRQLAEGYRYTNLQFNELSHWAREEILRLEAERDLLRESERELIETLEECRKLAGATLGPGKEGRFTHSAAVKIGHIAIALLSKHGR